MEGSLSLRPGGSASCLCSASQDGATPYRSLSGRKRRRACGRCDSPSSSTSSTAVGSGWSAESTSHEDNGKIWQDLGKERSLPTSSISTSGGSHGDARHAVRRKTTVPRQEEAYLSEALAEGDYAWLVRSAPYIPIGDVPDLMYSFRDMTDIVPEDCQDEWFFASL